MGALIPAAQLALAGYAENAVVVLTPAVTTFGLTSAQLTSLTGATNDFSAKLSTARDFSTRTKVTVALKNTSKLALISLIRALFKIVDAYPLTTDGQRAALGISIPDRTPTAIPAPTTQPVANIAGTGGGEAEVRLADELTPTSRRKPFGASGAQIFYAITPVGAPAPDFAADGVFDGVASKSTYRFALPAGSQGKLLWVQCRWMTARGLVGPSSVPTAATISA